MVRLPAIQALDAIFEAKTSLDASKRELMRPSTLRSAGDPAILAEELKRQQQSWQRAEKAWKTYEALPRSREEEIKWRQLVPSWNAWRTSYEKVMALLVDGRARDDQTLIVAAWRENTDILFDHARESRVLLTELIALNERAALAAKLDSINSQRDTVVVRVVMIVAALASVGGAIGCGVLISRMIGRPVARMADAFARIAGGDLDTRLPVNSRDEVGHMAAAMNGMMDSLRTSELRFRAVFENTFDAIGVSKEGRLIIANSSFLTLFGYERPQEVIGRAVTDFIAPPDHALVADRIRRRQLGEALPPLFTLTGVRRDGTTFTMEVQSSRFLLDGAPHLVAVHRDITERQRAAAQLAESASRLELALRTSQLGVWRRHLVTQEAQWDARMFAIFGLLPTAGPPSREQLRDLVLPEDQQAAWQAWNQTPTAGKIYEHRFRIRRPDGQVRHLAAHGMLQETAGRAPEWTIGVTSDVTEIVDAAAESTRLREQLLQAQKMETLGTLSAGIAHDFNNLLTGINGFIELAAATLPPGQESADLLRQARQGTLSARDLVRRILIFSRRSHTSQRTSLHLAEVVRETAPLISAALPAGVTLALDLAPDVAPVLADAGQIQQVLMNLCTNGAHAIGANGGVLRIGLRAHVFADVPAAPLVAGCPPGDYACLSVNDTGCGMDAATLKRIFEPFFTTKKPGEGTGLGLSIVADIMSAHKGGLDVQSAPGRGTTFSLYFPVTREVPVAPAPAAPVFTSPGTGQKIMVVDDEPVIAKVVQLVLQRAGYAPDVHTSSAEAWERFAEAPANYQLLMIDQQMPGLSGSDFIARAQQLRPDLAIVIMSGRIDRSEVDPDSGPARITHLKKPFEISTLLAQVSTLVPPPSPGEPAATRA